MNHKERMQYLKENDPIAYDEIMSDPSGGAYEISGCFIIFAVTIVVIIILSIILIASYYGNYRTVI